MTQAVKHILPDHLRQRHSARRREHTIVVVALALSVGCMVGAGFCLSPINKIRKERQLLINPETIEGLPPMMSLLTKLGTFRALAIDWASIRADRLKEEGKTYEALQLHLMVCRLAPRFPTVWSNAAWNMVYNISVMKYSPEERWQWVKNGIKLLRDQGIQYNPKAVHLYRELAWIYWHKIGDNVDDEHRNYKRALAVEMEIVLGPPPVTLSDQQYFDWFRRIVDAPRHLPDLLESDPQVARLASQLEQLGLGANEDLLEFVARHLRPELSVEDLLADEADVDSLTERRLKALTGGEVAGPRERLLAAIRSQVLRERYKFDVDRMLDLMENRFGPLDWRNAFAHTLYWSSLGDEAGRGTAKGSFADKVNTARLVFFSLQSMINFGKIALTPNFDDPFASYIDALPDTRYIPYLFETFMRLSKEHFGDDEGFVDGQIAANYRTGLVSDMHNWIQLLYLQGGKKNIAMAEDFFIWLRRNNPHPDGTPQSRYLLTLDKFVMGDLLQSLDTSKAVSGLVRAFVERALKQYSIGDAEAALTSLKRARACHDYWEKGTTPNLRQRANLQPLRIILGDQIVEYMNKREIDPIFKARLWRSLPLEQQQQTYDRLRPYFIALCAAQTPTWDLKAALPPPPGMEQYRSTDRRGIDVGRREGIDEGTRGKN